VHEWPLATYDDVAASGFAQLRTIDRVRTTDLFTVNETDVIDLALSLMDWQHVRYIPVEDEDHKLVGLLTYRRLLRHFTARSEDTPNDAVPVSEVMLRDVVSVPPETPTLECVRMMSEQKLGCLPITKDGALVGLVTEHDFYAISAPLFVASLESASLIAGSRAASSNGASHRLHVPATEAKGVDAKERSA